MGPTQVDRIMSRPVLGLAETDSASDAAILMTQRKISAVPVLHGGRLLGLVTETDLVHGLDQVACSANAADRLLSSEVRQLMRPHVMTVGPNAPLSEVIHLFGRYHIHHVPVAVQKMLLGIISDRDVRRALGWSSVCDMQAEAEGHLPGSELPAEAAEIMHRHVVTIAERNIHSLPVVDAEELVGIITRTDFLKAIVRQELLG
jgi:CBS domain-containing protein